MNCLEALHRFGKGRSAYVSRALSGFDYPTAKVGATPDQLITVYYAPSLGQQGLALAKDLLVKAAQAYATCQDYFGIQGQPVNLIVAPLSGSHDGSGGAYHYGCDFATGGDLYVDAWFGNVVGAIGLFIAELSECFQGLQGKGWACGSSNGEALSRFHAELASGGPKGALVDFGTGPAWAQAGYPNWVDATEPTDQDDVATGCGVLYIWWMVSRGFTPAQITRAGGATLAANYRVLTGQTTAWSDFDAAVRTLPRGITSDDPWPAPTPTPSPTPPPVPPSSKVQVVVDITDRTVIIPSDWRAVRHSTGDVDVHPTIKRVDLPPEWTAMNPAQIHDEEHDG
jgi:hypothetical protein